MSLCKVRPALSLIGILTLAAFAAPAAHAQNPAAAPQVRTFSESLVISLTGSSGPLPGKDPYYGTLAQGSDGNLYGATELGTPNGDGSVYQVSPSGTPDLLHSFTGALTDGAEPFAGVIQATDGNFWGTTEQGAAGYGIVFNITPAGDFTQVYAFSNSPSTGANPFATVVQGTDGDFYGTTEAGGANGLGTAFKLDSFGTLTLLHSFSSATTDGENPYGPLLQAADGNFYGTTSFGGAQNMGTVFKMTPAGTVSLLHSFSNAATDGAFPYAGLVQGTDGNFYGTTFNGGANSGFGTIFQISPTGTFKLLHSFSGSATDGGYPDAGLVQATDGNFYGTTYGGGANGNGTVYQITPSGVFTLVYSFAGGTADGNVPLAGLIQGADGNLYGTTAAGGALSSGTVYKITPSPALPAPVQLAVPATVGAGAAFHLSYLVTNAVSQTMKQCLATNDAGDSSGWAGTKTAATTATTANLIAPSAAGSYTYGLTCGGVESGFATLNVVTKDATSTSLAAAPNPATVGQTVTLIATVTHSSGSAKPAGTVTFSLNGSSIGSGPVSSAGVANLSAGTNGIPPGNYPVVATYSGDANYNPSASAALHVILNKAPTATTLTASPNPVTRPANITLSATVHRSASGATGTPAGTVTFYYQTAALGTVNLNAGVAKLTAPTSGQQAGNYPITAKYSGDSSDAASTSPAVTVVVR